MMIPKLGIGDVDLQSLFETAVATLKARYKISTQVTNPDYV